MYLKRLELHGFKSFADPADLHFSPGITAIVGPNGCGKSNIVDAIRWVLGEQSWKNLRGTRLEDAIFAGSSKRKSLGYAEVRLTLDNVDGSLPVEFAEVSVGRRAYRSGEGQAFLNKAECRLKDIHDLFMDTGLGRQAYAVVGQGQIEQVLSARPEDRRAWLEETAGVAKVRARKIESLRKLEETQRDLVRIEDLLAELRGRLGPLELEAGRARDYLDLSERLRSLEVGLYSRRLVKLARAWQGAEKQRQDAQQRLNALSTQVEGTSHELAALKERASASERRVNESLHRMSTLEREAGQAEHAAALADKERELRGQEVERMAAELVEYDRRLAELLERRDAVARHLDELQKRERTLQEAFQSEAETLSGVQAAEAALASLQAALLEAAQTTSRHAAEFKGAESRKSLLAQQIEHLSRRVAAAKELLERAAGDERLAVSGHKAAEKGFLERQVELTALTAAVKDELRPAYHASLRAIDESKDRLRAAKARLLAMEEMEKSRQGYYDGVKSILAARAQLGDGILGIVADLFRVESRWELALETSLGGSLQNIITKTEADAKKAIEYLRRTRSGRATFLPLAAIRPQRLDAATRQRLEGPGVVGVASDLVECDPVYQPVAELLLGRVIVVDTLETAVQLSKRITGYSRIVTTAGDFVVPGGAITGGKTESRPKGDLWSRRRERNELAERVADAEEALRLRTEEAEAARLGLSQSEQAVEALRQALHESDVRMAEARREQQRAVAERARAAGDVAAVERELADVERLLAAAGEAEGSFRTDLSDAANAEEALRRQVEAAAEQLRRERERVAEREAALTEHRVAQAAIAAEIQAALRNLVERDATIASTRQERLRKEDEKRRLAQLQDELMQKREQGRRHAEKVLGEHEQAMVLWRAECEARRALDEEVRQLDDDLERVRQAQESARRRLHDASLSADSLLAQIGRMRERLADWDVDPYETGSTQQDERPPLLQWARDVAAALDTRHDAPPEEDDVQSEAGMEREIAELRRRMRALEPVNMGAITEHSEVRERHEFLESQHRDLSLARESIESTIHEIDRTAKRRLETTYEAVRKAFADLFARLFGGGSADLVLTDGVNLLEAGLEIVAQPPGKKTQNLMALSGGERSLTAIALLFAAFAVKPSPFCVLDEIDAALDEVNVERFARLLRDFAGMAQFIVITHRARTMEEAGVLYGVTMEESGVSKVVSVRLRSETAQAI